MLGSFFTASHLDLGNYLSVVSSGSGTLEQWHFLLQEDKCTRNSQREEQLSEQGANTTSSWQKMYFWVVQSTTTCLLEIKGDWFSSSDFWTLSSLEKLPSTEYLPDDDVCILALILTVCLTHSWGFFFSPHIPSLVLIIIYQKLWDRGFVTTAEVILGSVNCQECWLDWWSGGLVFRPNRIPGPDLNNSNITVGAVLFSSVSPSFKKLTFSWTLSAKSLQSCPTPCNPMDHSLPRASV